MTSSRLLHAVARGARLQTEVLDGAWLNTFARTDYVQSNPDNYRIHPEDQHLQYGQISTELRKCVEEQTTFTCAYTDHGSWRINSYDLHLVQEALAGLSRTPKSVEQGHTFMLLLAESLADEGL